MVIEIDIAGGAPIAYPEPRAVRGDIDFLERWMDRLRDVDTVERGADVPPKND